MNEKFVNINKVYLASLPCIIFGTPILIIIYHYIHGTGYRDIINNNPNKLIELIFLIFGLIFLHEIIHGICFALFAKSGFKSIKFGVMWKNLAPYCHCKEAITAKQYRIVLLMPTFILGLLPLLIGVIVGNFSLFFSGIMLIWGGIGDIIAFFLTKKVANDTLVIDHPNKVGFYFKERTNLKK